MYEGVGRPKWPPKDFLLENRMDPTILVESALFIGTSMASFFYGRTKQLTSVKGTLTTLQCQLNSTIQALNTVNETKIISLEKSLHDLQEKYNFLSSEHDTLISNSSKTRLENLELRNSNTDLQSQLSHLRQRLDNITDK